jgi:hypothetical protein
MCCVTCLVSDYNQKSYQALKKALMMYKEEPTLSTKKEFAVWASYYHYLEEKPLEMDTWNRLKWLEYYDNPPVTLESQPCKLVTWKCPNPPCRGVFDDKKSPEDLSVLS